MQQCLYNRIILNKYCLIGYRWNKRWDEMLKIYQTVNCLRSFLSSGHSVIWSFGSFGLYLVHFVNFVNFGSSGSFGASGSFGSFGWFRSFRSFGQHCAERTDKRMNNIRTSRSALQTKTLVDIFFWTFGPPLLPPSPHPGGDPRHFFLTLFSNNWSSTSQHPFVVILPHSST